MPTADWAVIFFKYFRKGNRPFNHKVNKKSLHNICSCADFSPFSQHFTKKQLI